MIREQFTPKFRACTRGPLKLMGTPESLLLFEYPADNSIQDAVAPQASEKPVGGGLPVFFRQEGKMDLQRKIPIIFAKIKYFRCR